MEGARDFPVLAPLAIRAWNFAAIAILALSLGACTSIGPATVVRDRTDYGSSIGNSWKEQTLLNIVKLRYSDLAPA